MFDMIEWMVRWELLCLYVLCHSHKPISVQEQLKRLAGNRRRKGRFAQQVSKWPLHCWGKREQPNPVAHHQYSSTVSAGDVLQCFSICSWKTKDSGHYREKELPRAAVHINTKKPCSDIYKDIQPLPAFLTASQPLFHLAIEAWLMMVS